MELVEDWSDIASNLLTLERYRRSNDPTEVDYYEGLIKRGTCFVVCRVSRQLAFGPSRFLGYRENTLQEHTANPTKDGRVTNPRLEEILDKNFEFDSSLEEEYRRFCRSLGFAPREKGSFGVTRKYLYRGGRLFIPSEDLLIDDISEVSRNEEIDETEKQQFISARIGQGAFRESLIRYLGKCSVTGCTELTVLRASHIKPWRNCNNVERLDPYNGLLLIPNLDLAFDNGFITFDSEGKVKISSSLRNEDAEILGISEDLKINLSSNHKPYLAFHRDNIFTV